MAESALVGILVGSESDRERMQPAFDELEQRGIAFEFDVRSAHRTPDAVAEYARTARERGLRVLICGAGLSAALPGVVAAHTDLPVGGGRCKDGDHGHGPRGELSDDSHRHAGRTGDPHRPGDP